MPADELPNELRVGAWMNPPDFTIKPDTLVDEALETMWRENIRHLLVVDADELVGVVTDRDLRRPTSPDGKVMSVNELYQVGEKLAVRDVMSENVVTAEPSDHTAGAAKLMVENKINCLPVVRDRKVVGILTTTDLLAALVHEVDPAAIAARELEG